jgi:hypothetical protein
MDKTGIATQALSTLGKAYLHPLALMSQFAERPSLVWRGDSMVLGRGTPRWSYRVGVGERGRWRLRPIGFCNLRPLDKVPEEGLPEGSQVPVVGEAYLAPPVRMLDKSSGYVIYTRSRLQRLYGEETPTGNDELVTCFCQPHRLMGGYCAHAAQFMSLVMMSRMDLRVPALHETSYDVARRKGEICKQDGSFVVRGLELLEMWHHMKSPLVNGSAVIEVHEVQDATSIGVFGRTLNEYLRQNLPVVLAVDFAQLHADEPEYLQGLDPNRTEHPHVIVLVGAFYGPSPRSSRYDPIKFVFHDSTAAPYLERSVRTLAEVAGSLGKRPGRAAFLVPMPRGVERSIKDLNDFVNACVESRPNERSPNYESVPRGAIPHYRLLHGRSIEGYYFSDLPRTDPVRMALREKAGNLPTWTWAIEWYRDRQDMESRQVTALWLLDATKELQQKYAFLAGGGFAYVGRQWFRCLIPKFLDKPAPVPGLLRVKDEGLPQW